MASHGIDLDWRLRAACRNSGLDPDTWFPDPSDDQAAKTAKRICRQCPVQHHCGTYAERIRATYGIWAGYRRNKDGAISGHHTMAARA